MVYRKVQELRADALMTEQKQHWNVVKPDTLDTSCDNPTRRQAPESTSPQAKTTADILQLNPVPSNEIQEANGESRHVSSSESGQMSKSASDDMASSESDQMPSNASDEMAVTVREIFVQPTPRMSHQRRDIPDTAHTINPITEQPYTPPHDQHDARNEAAHVQHSVAIVNPPEHAFAVPDQRKDPYAHTLRMERHADSGNVSGVADAMFGSSDNSDMVASPFAISGDAAHSRSMAFESTASAMMSPFSTDNHPPAMDFGDDTLEPQSNLDRSTDDPFANCHNEFEANDDFGFFDDTSGPMF